MRKLILSALSILLVSLSARTQPAYGPEAGLNISNYRISTPALVAPATIAVPGFKVGGIIDHNIGDHVCLQPGLFYALNGISYSYNFPFIGNISFSSHFSSIQVPINVLYKLGKKGANRFFFGAGVFAGINLGGSAKASSSNNPLLAGSGLPPDSSSTIKVGSDSSSYIKRFDFGIGINAGYEMTKGFVFRAYFQRGLLNMSPVNGGTDGIKSMNYGVSVAYLFGRKPVKKQENKKPVKKGK